MSTTKSILLLGSGLMAEAVADFYNKYSNYRITFGTNDKASGEKLTSINSSRYSLCILDAVKDKEKLSELVRDHDITISLLPSFLHIHVAKVCLKENKNMVTSSYISEGNILIKSFKGNG